MGVDEADPFRTQKRREPPPAAPVDTGLSAQNVHAEPFGPKVFAEYALFIKKCENKPKEVAESPRHSCGEYLSASHP